MSKIEWTEKTWNPLAGCSKVSAGCQNCYALIMANRLANIGSTREKYKDTTRKTESGKVQWTGKVNFDEKALLEPLRRKKPTIYFVNSMSDLFHENVKEEWIDKVFAVMALCPQHTFQVLTKRPKRMKEYFLSREVNTSQKFRILKASEQFDSYATSEQVKHLSDKVWYDLLQGETKVDRNTRNYVFLKNVWLGVSVENQEAANERIPYLLETPAHKRFVSAEPLLGNIDLDNIHLRYEYCINSLNGKVYFREWEEEFQKYEYQEYLNGHYEKLDWVIAGGESGKNARPMHVNWVRSIRDKCKEAGTAFFFKQWGELDPNNNYETTVYRVRKKEAGNLIGGKEYKEYLRLLLM